MVNKSPKKSRYVTNFSIDCNSEEILELFKNNGYMGMFMADTFVASKTIYAASASYGFQAFAFDGTSPFSKRNSTVYQILVDDEVPCGELVFEDYTSINDENFKRGVGIKIKTNSRDIQKAINYIESDFLQYKGTWYGVKKRIDVRSFGNFESYVKLEQEDSPVKMWAVKDDVNFEANLEATIQYVELAVALEKTL